MSKFALTVTIACLFSVVAVARGDEPAAPPAEQKPTQADAAEAIPATPDTSYPGTGGFGGGFGGSGVGYGFGFPGGGGVAMGLPASAIPGRKWVAGSKVIVAFSDDGKQAFAYTEQHPRWAARDLEPVTGCVAVPVVTDDSAAVRYGHFCYAYSTTLGTWDVLKLPEGEAAVPAVSTDGISVHSESQGDFVFKNSWGKWFSADEIKAGRVAEHLLVQRNAAEDVQLEVRANEVITVIKLKYIQATEALRIVRQLYGLSVKRAAADERANSLIVVGVDPSPLSKVRELLQAIDSPAAKDLALPQPAQSVDDLGKLYNELDQRARQLAAKLRDPAQNVPAAKQLNEELRTTVRAAFDARQKLQRAELAEFAQRLQGIQQSIEMRDRIGNQIIDHRVEELLNPALRWEGTDVADRPVAPATNDASEIQGLWRLERLLIPGGTSGTPIDVQELIVAGEMWTIRSYETTTAGVLRVDPTCDPKAIDFIGETNGGRDTTLAIYRLNDDRLEILTFPDGRAHRPASFDEQNACVQIYKRVVDLSGRMPSDRAVATAQWPPELPAGTWPGLEGTWQLVSQTSTDPQFDARMHGTFAELTPTPMIIRGNRRLRTARDGEQSERAFVYDPNSTPQTIDFLRVRDGKSYTSRYIIEVNGDTLRLGWNFNGGNERAKSFEAPRVLIMNYQRVQVGDTADGPNVGQTTVPDPEFKRVAQPVNDELPQPLP